jgi:E3 ubiquitin-protein ligase Topors
MEHIWPVFCAVCSNVIFYCRNHPEEVHRLIPWLNRELQAILRAPGLSALVLDLVISQLPHSHMLSEQFRRPLVSYLREHCDHFIHEFSSFASSPYDMIGFDENARYTVLSNFNSFGVCVNCIMSQQCVCFPTCK